MSIPPKFTTKDGLGFEVRQAVPDDAEQLIAGIQAVLQERSDYFVTQLEDFALTVEQEREWIQKHTESDNSVLLVAEHERKIVGWVILRGGDRLRTRHTGTLGITVLKAWRGRGVGTALMETLLDWATENAVVEKIKLGVVASNEPAIRLYRKLGFVEEGWQPHELKKEDGTYLNNLLMYRLVV
jgi:ribosomal protein S18 acetylase RimI-like enzyme